MKAKVTLFKESGKYYTEEEWEVPEKAATPHDMENSIDFRRIGGGAVLVQTQEPWGYPCLFPNDPDYVGGWKFDKTSEVEPVEPAPEWTAAEWQYVLTGDRVRIGVQEADVTTSSNSVGAAGDFHADSTDEYRPKRWDHKEVRVRLAHLDNTMLQFSPSAPVEILCTRERAAQLLLQSA